MYTKNISFTLTPGDSQLSGVRTKVVALFSDIRGFSSWSETQPLDNVADLMKAQFERVIQICNDHHHSFHKFLGDGFVLLWEPDGELGLDHCLAHALDAAFHLHKKYWHLSKNLVYAAPSGYGVGISIGDAMRIQPETFLKEMNEVDFVGYPLNCAARMQTLAAAYGTVVCSKTAQMLERDAATFLHPDVPELRRALIAPNHAMIERASQMKGLKPADRSDFRFLSYVDDQQRLWRTTGMPDEV